MRSGAHDDRVALADVGRQQLELACAGRGTCHSSTGSSSGTPSSRACQGRRIASSTPPRTPAAPAHTGAAGAETVANGSAASQPRYSVSACTAAAATSQATGASTPAIASGVTTSVTHGMASALASRPTTDTCPNSSSVSGVRAIVITHCSRIARASAEPALPMRSRQPLSTASAAACTGSPASVANSTPTATKLSQKPACNSAHGSIVTTTAQASSHTCGHGQRRPDRRSKPTVASIQTVRCAGTPQPLNSA